MRRYVVLLVTALHFCLGSGVALGADLAKEGNGSYRGVNSATFKSLPMEKERLEMQFEITGVVDEAPPESPLHEATLYGLSELHAYKGDYTERGFARYVRPDGDAIFMSYEATGKLGGDRMLTGTFVGGTGKCTGITGGVELRGVHRLKAPRDGAAMSVSVGTHHWKIP